MAKKNFSSKDKLHFLFFSYAAAGIGISGGDRIFIELGKRWFKKANIDIYVSDEGYEMCKRQKFDSGVHFNISKTSYWRKFGFIVEYIAKILIGVDTAFSLDIPNSPNTILYSASEFWMDSLPCIILKMRFPNVILVATWFQTAPNPVKGFSEKKRENTYRFRALLYWLAQMPIKPLFAKYADIVFVNNEDEKKRFPELNKRKRVIPLIGAVPLGEIQEFQKKNKNLKKIYDAVYQGRFHPQKGVAEMVHIWKRVVNTIPYAQLVMCGDGPLMEEVKTAVKDEKLENNITLLGWVFDGNKKFKTFAQSKIVVHPAFYDSGGMAAADAMVFRLPCVGFNLKSYESYYPQGMVKSKDEEEFAKNIIKLLQNTKLRTKIGKEAEQMIVKNYSWDKRAEELYNTIVTKTQ